MVLHLVLKSLGMAYKITRPSSNSEAITMYKLKGQSSNMQTVQSFKNKELVCPSGPIPLVGLPNWLRLACLQVARLFRLAELARLVRLVRLG